MKESIRRISLILGNIALNHCQLLRDRLHLVSIVRLLVDLDLNVLLCQIACCCVPLLQLTRVDVMCQGYILGLHVLLDLFLNTDVQSSKAMMQVFRENT